MSEPVDPRAEAERVITSALEAWPEAERVRLLTALLHRASVELNKSARQRSNETRGQPEWGTWAGLQNTTRSLVLQASTCRDLVEKLSREESGQGAE